MEIDEGPKSEALGGTDPSSPSDDSLPRPTTDGAEGAETRELSKPLIYFFLAIALIWSLLVVGSRSSRGDGVASASVVLEGGVPVTIYVPGGEPVLGPAAVEGEPTSKYPLVVLAHGYTGDRVGLEYLARSLAKSGYVVATYDAPGHGQNTNLFGNAGPTHQRAMDVVVEWARQHPSVDPAKVAVGGHSMGASTAVEYASRSEEVGAVLAISGGWSYTGKHPPANTLLLYASGDPAALRSRVSKLASRIVGIADMEKSRIYGNPTNRTATSLVEISGADHFSVVASADTVGYLVAWLNVTLRAGQGPEKSRALEVGILEPASEARVARRSPLEGLGLLAILVFLLAVASGYLVGRIQGQNRAGSRINNAASPLRAAALWLVALAAALVVGKALGGAEVLPLGIFSSLSLISAVAGSIAALWLVFGKRSQRRGAAEPSRLSGDTGNSGKASAASPSDAVVQQMGATGDAVGQEMGATGGSRFSSGAPAAAFGATALVVLLASLVSRLHGIYLDPKRILVAVLLALLFFPALWSLEELSRHRGLAGSLAVSAVLKFLFVVAVSLSIAAGLAPPVLALGIPLLVLLLALFEGFALAAYRRGASVAVIAAAEAVALGWIGAVLGPLQF
jgi:dienelactone hydrolase